MLEQMEQALAAEDPKFASQMQGSSLASLQRRRWLVGAVGVIAGLALVLAGPATSAPQATNFKNCTALNKDYPHGVGRQGARDKTSGTPVTTFKVSNSLYAANRGSDRDKDGIACEKR